MSTLAEMRWLAALVLCVGCVHADRVALATSTAALACDWGYTHAAAADGWRKFYEANPIMGPEPTTTEVSVYFASAITINAVVWALTPPTYRAALPAAVTARQTYSIAHNAHSMGGACGL